MRCWHLCHEKELAFVKCLFCLCERLSLPSVPLVPCRGGVSRGESRVFLGRIPLGHAGNDRLCHWVWFDGSLWRIFGSTFVRGIGLQFSFVVFVLLWYQDDVDITECVRK
jgi:hypothetical protein